MLRWFLLSTLALFSAIGFAADSAGPQRDLASFLREARDLDRLPYLEQGVISRQFSSYHRASHYDRKKKQCVGMDRNGDSGHKPTVHFGADAAAELQAFDIPAGTPRFAFGDLEWVLDPVERNDIFFLPRTGVAEPQTEPPANIVAAIPGPGCIVRIWSANPSGEISFYFDGNTKPLTFDFKRLFLGGVTEPDAATWARRAEWPFIRPLVFRRPGEGDHLASDCYLTIPFARSCIVTLSRPAFYHIGYKTLPPEAEVETFTLPLRAAALSELDKTCQALRDCGSNPRSPRSEIETVRKTVELPPGQPVVLANLRGPRIIESLHARLKGRERYAGSKVLLTAEFDGESCIWTPIINFFGTAFGPHDYRSYPLGYIDGEGYCFYPMPFRRSGRFVIINEGSKPAALTYRLTHRAVDSLPRTTMHFKCKYRREPVCKTFDYPFLQCEGEGRFVGAALFIQDAWRSWWGEGDEKIWVDGDVFPSFFGTGSEDFFGDAWGIRTLHQPFFACSFIEQKPEQARTCCYRWMIPDDVPFHQRFKATIENYPETLWGTKVVEWDEDYASVAYWYQMPGGKDFFRPVPVAERRPWGKAPKPPVVEAETALASELERGAKLIDDEQLDYEFSRGSAIDLGTRQPGETIRLLGPEICAEGPYAVFFHHPRDMQHPAAFRVSVGAKSIGATPLGFGAGDRVKVGLGVFPPGRTELQVEFTSTGPAVFDCVQLSPARQLANVTEAEKATVVVRQGPEPVADIDVMWSGGKQLRFPAAGPGDSIELAVTVPAGKWSLCVGQTAGPRYGDYQVLVNDRPVAVLRGYSAKHRVRDWIKLTSLKGANGQMRLRFVCTGKDPRANGRELGLDYIGWQRLVVESAIEGELAEVIDVKDGRITDQKLGDRFSGGNHLWFHPTKVGASFTWPLDVPADGAYELCIYFTKSWDYAIVRLSLDGKALGEFDTYAPTVTWAGKTSLGVHELKQGRVNLRFEVVGKNELSKGILVGVDCLTLKPVEP